MKWNDIQQIAEALYDQYPDVDPTRLNFVDLHNKVVSLDGFDDDHKRGGEVSRGDPAGVDRRGGGLIVPAACAHEKTGPRA